MNSYITLDGYKYTTPFGRWEPSTIKPTTVRDVLTGSLDVTYGPVIRKEWNGEIEVAGTPSSGYGSYANLIVSLTKIVSIALIDHYGDTYTVHSVSALRVNSMTPMWDAASNMRSIPVRLVAEA